MENEKLLGTIERWSPVQKIGTIAAGKRRFFFHQHQIAFGLVKDLRVGVAVTFFPSKYAPKPGHLPNANFIEILEDQTSGLANLLSSKSDEAVQS